MVVNGQDAIVVGYNESIPREETSPLITPALYTVENAYFSRQIPARRAHLFSAFTLAACW